MLSELFAKIGNWIEETMYSIERITIQKGLLYLSGRDLIGVVIGLLVGIVICLGIYALMSDFERK